jgi:hypothetical protein
VRTRRSALALIGAGTACLAATAFPAVHATAAAAEPGSGLGSFNLSASAPAVQLRQEETTYCFGTSAGLNGCEGVIPEAVSTLRNGPIGNALAAVVWPGVLAGNLGSLLVTAGGGNVPDTATTLNDPIRAEAHTSTGPDTVTYDQVPGTLMKAVAKDTLVSADAAVSSTQDTPVGTFGKSTGRSSTELTGPSSAVATAHTSVQDISLAAGQVRIGSVTSDAKATTDGKTATRTGKTVVTGMTIAGIPVSVGERGITVNSSILPLKDATDLVNSALKQAGMSIAVSQPSGKPKGASVTYNAGSLVFVWKPQAGYTTTVVLGGANVSVVASPALDFNLPIPGTTTPIGTVPGTTTPPASGSGNPPGATVPGVTPPTVAGTTPHAPNPVLAAARLKLPSGLPAGLALVGVFGSGLIAAGLRRLPDRLLEVTPPTCLFEETS